MVWRELLGTEAAVDLHREYGRWRRTEPPSLQWPGQVPVSKMGRNYRTTSVPEASNSTPAKSNEAKGKRCTKSVAKAKTGGETQGQLPARSVISVARRRETWGLAATDKRREGKRGEQRRERQGERERGREDRMDGLLPGAGETERGRRGILSRSTVRETIEMEK